jgi:hypothetical protein
MEAAPMISGVGARNEVPGMYIGFLEEIHDETVSAIEDLLLDYTGEAKSTISGLQVRLAANDAVSLAVTTEIVSILEDILGKLRVDNYDVTARRQIVTLRRRIRNTIRSAQGLGAAYNYAEPFV